MFTQPVYVPSKTANSKQHRLNTQFAVAELETNIATRYLDNQFVKMKEELDKESFRDNRDADKLGEGRTAVDRSDRGRYQDHFENYDLRKIKEVATVKQIRFSPKRPAFVPYDHPTDFNLVTPSKFNKKWRPGVKQHKSQMGDYRLQSKNQKTEITKDQKEKEKRDLSEMQEKPGDQVSFEMTLAEDNYKKEERDATQTSARDDRARSSLKERQAIDLLKNKAKQRRSSEKASKRKNRDDGTGRGWLAKHLAGIDIASLKKSLRNDTLNYSPSKTGSSFRKTAELFVLLDDDFLETYYDKTRAKTPIKTPNKPEGNPVHTAGIRDLTSPGWSPEKSADRSLADR